MSYNTRSELLGFNMAAKFLARIIHETLVLIEFLARKHRTDIRIFILCLMVPISAKHLNPPPPTPLNEKEIAYLEMFSCGALRKHDTGRIILV